MTSDRLHTVLRKKAEAGRPPPPGAPMTPDRAISQALVRAAQDRLNLAAQVVDLKETRMTLSDLPEALEDLSLLAMVEGPGEGLGLVALPPRMMSALIEAQTMGRLSAHAPPARRPTRTDATMSADFIDTVLAAVEESLAADEAITWAGGFRYASFMDDPRPLGLLLEDVSYRVYRAQLRLGAGGEREAGFLWAVPAQGRGPGPDRIALARRGGADPVQGGDAPDAIDAQAQWQTQMERSVLAAPVTLNAVLHRMTVPLSAVLSLRVGMDIPLPADALETLRLEGSGGRHVAGGRLGQARGMRALRVVPRSETGEEDPAADSPEASGTTLAPMPRPSARMATSPPGFLSENARNEARSFDLDLPAPANFGADMPGLAGGLDPLAGGLDPAPADDGAGLAPLRMGSAF